MCKEENAVGTVLWLGAGFAVPAGLPTAAGLFDQVPFPNSKRALRDIEATLSAWKNWREAHPDTAPEEFISAVYESDPLQIVGHWPSIVRFLGYRLASTFATFYPYEGRTARSRDNIFEARLCPAHAQWWEAVLTHARPNALTVITTNWDICIERALRPKPMQRPRRPGFHYGWGPERLTATTAYPRSSWRENPCISGSVPVLKLHGSLNWALENGRLVKYGDLRPAFRGDAALVPPMRHKERPSWAEELWQMARTALRTARRVIVAGYSFPPYDEQIHTLFREGICSTDSHIHVFDPDARTVCRRISSLLARAPVSGHPGLPQAVADLPVIFS